MTVQPPAVPAVPATRALPRKRAAYAALTLALLAALVFEVVQHGHWGMALAGLVLPDLALLFGAGTGLAHGQLHPRAVRAYNAAHRVAGPLVLLVLASVGLLAVGWFVAGLAWALHVALDRSLGYGLRDPEGFQRDR